MQFLAGHRGRGYVRPFLLECPSQEVRFAFAAFLVRSCDVSTQITVEPRSLRPTFPDTVRTDPLILIPPQMGDAIFRVNNDTYIREMSTTICDVMGTSQQIANMFIHCSWCNDTSVFKSYRISGFFWLLYPLMI